MARRRKPEPGPSEQQAKETAPAFEAFRTYLEMGPRRSTAKVARALGKSKTLIDRWSSRWRWSARVREFEGEATRRSDTEHLDAIARRARRQAEIAQLHGEATAFVAREIVTRVTKAGQQGRDRDPMVKLSMGELLQLEATLARAHNRAVLTERLALGMTTGQEGEPMPRSEAEEAARRLTDAELDARLTGVADLDEQRAKRAKRKRATG